MSTFAHEAVNDEERPEECRSSREREPAGRREMALPQIALDDGRQHQHGSGPQTRLPGVDPRPLQAFSPRQQTGADDGLRQEQADSAEEDDALRSR